MTISEHLQFSVLTAPIASFDRRALSQAWYSALYGEPQPVRVPAEQTQKPSERLRAQCKPVTAPTEAPQTKAAGSSMRAHATQSLSRGGEIERRGPRSALARKIERTFLHPKPAARKASFTFESEFGRVQVLLHSNGSHMKLVAVCSAKAKAYVARALAQASYALALRGIDLESQTREHTSC